MRRAFLSRAFQRPEAIDMKRPTLHTGPSVGTQKKTTTTPTVDKESRGNKNGRRNTQGKTTKQRKNVGQSDVAPLTEWLTGKVVGRKIRAVRAVLAVAVVQSNGGGGGAPPVAGRRPTVGTPAAAAVTRPPNAATACRPPTGHWTRPDPSGPARPRRADRSSHLHRVRNETKQQQQHGNRETRRRQMRTTTWWWLVRAATDRWRVGPFWPKPSVAFVPTDADGSAAQRPSACLTRHLRNTNERRLGRRAAETGAHIKSMTNERSTHVRPTADQALEVERKRNDR